MNKEFTKNKYTISANLLIELSVGYLLSVNNFSTTEEVGSAVNKFIREKLQLPHIVSTDEVRDAIFIKLVENDDCRICSIEQIRKAIETVLMDYPVLSKFDYVKLADDIFEQLDSPAKK
jgi:formate dehydrogenase assembly factor FdhD